MSLIRKRNKKIEQEAELSLIPVMNLFVCLIPFLLISAAFVRMGAIKVDVPSESKGSQADVEQASKLVLTFKLENGKVTVEGFSQNFQNNIASLKKVFFLSELELMKTYLLELKSKNESVQVSLFYATQESKYQDAISVLNAIETSGLESSIAIATGMVD